MLFARGKEFIFTANSCQCSPMSFNTPKINIVPWNLRKILKMLACNILTLYCTLIWHYIELLETKISIDVQNRNCRLDLNETRIYINNEYGKILLAEYQSLQQAYQAGLLYSFENSLSIHYLPITNIHKTKSDFNILIR